MPDPAALTVAAEPARARLFFALPPPPALRQSLAALARQWRTEAGGRCVTAEGLHLTLLFLGGVERVRLAELSAAAASLAAEPFQLQLDGVECWAKPRVGVCVAKSAPPALFDLAEALAVRMRNLGIEFDARRLRPHVTLLRKLSCAEAGRTDLSTTLTTALTWTVAEFALYESCTRPAGAEYRVRGRFSLAQR